MEIRFQGELFQWRGPAPFYWVRLPEAADEAVRAVAAEASYGWGAIPVCALIGDIEWETSLLPKDGCYLLPVKKMVRERENLDDGGRVSVAMSIAPRGGRAANGVVPAC